MTRTNRYIWTAAFGQLESPPPGPPEFLSEPQYAAFLFEPLCSNKNCSKRVMKPDYHLTLRLCPEHYKESLTPWDTVFQQLQEFGLYPSSPHDAPPEFPWDAYVRRPDEHFAVITRWSGLVSGHDLERLRRLINEQVDPNAAPEVSKALVAALAQEHRTYVAHETERAQATKEWSARLFGLRKNDLQKIRFDRVHEIESRLEALGWNPQDIDHVRSYDLAGAERDREWMNLVYVSVRLTEKMWIKILPELEATLEIRRTKRLEWEAKRERERRQKALRDLVAQQVAEDVEARKRIPCPTYGPRANLSSSKLAQTIALLSTENAPDDHEYPTLDSLLALDAPEPSLELVRHARRPLRRDIRLLEMCLRESLVELIRLSQSTSQSDPAVVSDWKLGQTGLTRGELEATDGENLELLLHPTTLFVVDHRFDSQPSVYEKGCRPCVVGYPEVLAHAKSLRPVGAIRDIQHLRPVADELAMQLGIQDESMFTLTKGGTDRSAMFECESCPPSVQATYTWIDLVRHVLQHREWVSYLGTTLGVAPLRNSHETVQVARLFPGELPITSDANLFRFFACKLCPSTPPRWRSDFGEDLVALAHFPISATLMYDHMEDIHGFQREEAGKYIAIDAGHV